MFDISIDDLDESQKNYLLEKSSSFLGMVYLSNKFNNLTIEVLADPGSDLFTLAKKEKLEGWCWV